MRDGLSRKLLFTLTYYDIDIWPHAAVHILQWSANTVYVYLIEYTRGVMLFYFVDIILAWQFVADAWDACTRIRQDYVTGTLE